MTCSTPWNTRTPAVTLASASSLYVARRSLEAIAVEGYRTGALTEAQVRRLLELDTRFQAHTLLKEHHVPLRYSEADLEDDLFTHRELDILLVR